MGGGQHRVERRPRAAAARDAMVDELSSLYTPPRGVVAKREELCIGMLVASADSAVECDGLGRGHREAFLTRLLTKIVYATVGYCTRFERTVTANTDATLRASRMVSLHGDFVHDSARNGQFLVQSAGDGCSETGDVPAGAATTAARDLLAVAGSCGRGPGASRPPWREQERSGRAGGPGPRARAGNQRGRHASPGEAG